MKKSDLLYDIYTAGADLRNTSAQSSQFPDVLAAFDAALAEFESHIHDEHLAEKMQIVFNSARSVWVLDNDAGEFHTYELASAWTLNGAQYTGSFKL